MPTNCQIRQNKQRKEKIIKKISNSTGIELIRASYKYFQGHKGWNIFRYKTDDCDDG